ncbi:MAG TPA: hypothetical protein DEV64_01735 [Rhodospirillaceae bacterium]|nr:hypothetical protein [Rhodospirillaceae bacterium]
MQSVDGEDDRTALDPGDIDVFACTSNQFKHAPTETIHTVNRSLTDPRIFSDLGNAYSDEFLQRARLSTVPRTGEISDDQVRSLFRNTVNTL